MNKYLEKAKQVALFMLDMPYSDVKDFEGLFILHPFFNSNFLADKEGLFNIKDDPERFKRLKKELRVLINKRDSIEGVMTLILDSNKINFLYLLSQREVPAEVCGNLLGGVWCSLENNDTQEPFMKEAMRDWLLAADRTQIMSEEDIQLLNNLPDKVTIYRGAQFNEPPKGFCWSINRDVAVWFANRFQNKNPIVYTTTVNKKDILFYTNDAGEEETVVDYKKLGKIETQKL